MGKQPYDKVNKNMVIPHLFPKGKDDKAPTGKNTTGARPSTLAWNMPVFHYSGEYDFVETSYVFPITHMVAPKDNVVACQ